MSEYHCKRCGNGTFSNVVLGDQEGIEPSVYGSCSMCGQMFGRGWISESDLAKLVGRFPTLSEEAEAYVMGSGAAGL